MMRKGFLKAIGFLMATCLFVSSSYFRIDEGTPVVSVEAATTERYVFIQPDSSTNNIVESNSTVNMTTSNLTLFVSKVDETDTPIGFNSNVTVDIYSGNESVVSVEPYDPSDTTQSPFARTLKREGPGYAQITAVISDPDAGTSTIITCLVHVELQVVKTDTVHWKSVNLDGSHRVLVLNQQELSDYQLSLKYVDDTNIESADLTWAFSKDGVVSIDDGKLHIEGAGQTTVTITTDTNNGQSQADTATFEVIVTPFGAAAEGAISTYSQSVNMTVDASNFTLYTNSAPASNLIWEVYSKDVNGELTKINQSNTTLLTYSISEETGVVNFSGVKAGTYEVRAYSTKDYDAPWALLTYNIVVNFSLRDMTLFMNVGDTYSILNNSNIPAALFSQLFGFTVEPASGLIADIDGSNGKITAYNEGQAKIVMRYNKTSQYGIFDSTVATGIGDVTYTVEVIDGISLNSSSLSLYTGATYQLKANITNRTEAITWTSSDESTATVDATGLVTALKATGSNRPVQITVSQTINGIVKSATCNIYIQPSVTAITLNPTATTLEIGEYETIKATLTPSGIANISLKWVSSDSSIFEIVDSTDLSATIQGKSGGIAVLTAINSENVVVGYCTVTVNQQAAGIKLSETKVTSNLATKNYQLYATLTPANTTDQNIIWSTTNDSIATVDQNGKVTFVKSGTVSIIAQSADNPALTAYCEFTIQKAVTGVTLDVESIELYAGQNYRLTYLVTPSTASIPEVIWTSYDTSIVVVDSTGMLSAKGVGTTLVRVKTVDGSYDDMCTVIVKQKATKVKMNISELVMNAGEYFDMDVTITPATSTETSLTWESLNTKVVTVSSTGRVTARSEGTAVILVKTESGVTSYCTVTVLQPVRSLELDPSDIVIDVGEKFTIDPIFNPETASNTTVDWTSSDNKIATVNSIGEVTGVSGGTVVITCESVDGGYRAFCLVRVEEAVIDIVVTPETYRLGYGKTYTLEATITNKDTATDIEILWSSSDDSVVSVDQKGRITGVNYGYATITAESADGSGAYDTCEVRVVREVTSIKLNRTAVTIIQGQNVALQTTIQPSNATYKTATFNSDDDTIAYVDEDGVITGIKPGVTWVWARAKDNSGKFAGCYVTVIAPVAATGVSVSDSEIVLIPGEKKAITAAIKPTTSTDSMTWSSNNEAIARVDGNGTITAVSTGTATVTVMTTSGKTSTINVIVLGLSRSTIEIPVYTQYTRLTVNGATGTVRWDVKDPTICEINNGVITARKAGTTEIWATINGRTLVCKIKVTEK